MTAERPIDVAAWRRQTRAALLDARRAMPLGAHRAASVAIMRGLTACLPPTAGVTTGCYWPVKREPDCLPYMREVLREGGRVALPVVVGRGMPLEFRLWTEDAKMEAGAWGIPHPADGPPVVPDALVVPLVGFDEVGYRLGYGAGYYDVTLASLSPRPLAVGVGFEFSRLVTIHPQAHDMAMDVIVTELGNQVFHQPSSGDPAQSGRRVP
jgi:5-formyltetrahydrofolate cyclo-ligase